MWWGHGALGTLLGLLWMRWAGKQIVQTDVAECGVPESIACLWGVAAHKSLVDWLLRPMTGYCCPPGSLQEDLGGQKHSEEKNLGCMSHVLVL